MAPRCALAKIYFYRLPFQFNPIHFARLSISQAACFFFQDFDFWPQVRRVSNCAWIWFSNPPAAPLSSGPSEVASAFLAVGFMANWVVLWMGKSAASEENIYA